MGSSISVKPMGVRPMGLERFRRKKTGRVSREGTPGLPPSLAVALVGRLAYFEPGNLPALIRSP